MKQAQALKCLITPDIFYDKNNMIDDTTEEYSSLIEDGNIQYLDSVKEDIKSGKRTYKLGYNIVKNKDGEDILEIEMLINPWSKQFIKANEDGSESYIDINELAKYDEKIRDITNSYSN